MSMWQEVNLTLVSRYNPTVFPWTQSPALVGNPRVAETSFFTDLTQVALSRVGVLWPLRGSSTKLQANKLTVMTCANGAP